MNLKCMNILFILFIVSYVYCDEKDVCENNNASCEKEKVNIYSELNGLEKK